MEKLSVYIVAKNEETHIKEVVISALKVAEEVIVVDSGSTDKTKNIASKAGAKVIFHKWKNISAQKQFAEKQCVNDWVMNLDADEVLPPALQTEINQFMQNPTADACKLKIGDMFPGYTKPRKLGRTYNIVRMYNQKSAYMPDDFNNDRAVFKVTNPKIHQFKTVVHHYSYQGLGKLITKLNTFTDAIVETMLKKDKKYCPLRIYIEFPTQFLKYYFLKRYIFNGYYGFLVSVIYAFFRFIRLAKYKEAIRKK